MLKNINIQYLEKVKIIYNLSRSISTANLILNKYAGREGKFINKIMRGEQVKRKWYMDNRSVVANGEAPKRPSAPPSNRRNTVLNKIFMKYITDLMATGEVAPDIVGKGIEVTRVSVTPDFRLVNVFWLAKESEEKDKLVEEILTRAEGPLRHELSQLRVMGVVPLIKFVRDKQFLKFIEIDRRLANADFGEDYVPTDPTLKIKTTPVLNLKLPADVWSDIEQLEIDIKDNEMEVAEEPLPDMRNDVLGLDHHRIMTKVKISMDKSKVAFQNRVLNIVSPVPRDGEQSSQVTEYLTMKQRNAAFSEFLAKRQLDERRRKKMDINNPDPKEDLDFFNRNEFDDNYEDLDVDDEVFDTDIHTEEMNNDKFI